MQKIGNITNAATAAGGFTDGNVASGISPTILDAAWFNTMQRELANIVQAGGLTLDSTNDAQALSAIQALSLQKANNLSEIKAAGAASQAAALTNLGSSDGTLKGRLIGPPKIITSSETYNSATGTNFVIVEVRGASGRSGACQATSSTQGAASVGAGAGAYANVMITSGFNGATITVGIGGAAPTAGANSGVSGGTSSFGSLVIAPGGTGGGFGVASATPILSATGGTSAAPSVAASSTVIQIEAFCGQAASPAFMYVPASIIGSSGGKFTRRHWRMGSLG